MNMRNLEKSIDILLDNKKVENKRIIQNVIDNINFCFISLIQEIERDRYLDCRDGFSYGYAYEQIYDTADPLNNLGIEIFFKGCKTLNDNEYKLLYTILNEDARYLGVIQETVKDIFLFTDKNGNRVIDSIKDYKDFLSKKINILYLFDKNLKIAYNDIKSNRKENVEKDVLVNEY